MFMHIEHHEFTPISPILVQHCRVNSNLPSFHICNFFSLTVRNLALLIHCSTCLYVANLPTSAVLPFT